MAVIGSGAERLPDYNVIGLGAALSTGKANEYAGLEYTMTRKSINPRWGYDKNVALPLQRIY